MSDNPRNIAHLSGGIVGLSPTVTSHHCQIVCLFKPIGITATCLHLESGITYFVQIVQLKNMEAVKLKVKNC